MKTKRVPFDLEKVKQGAKVVTDNGEPVRINCYDRKTDTDYTIVGLVLRKKGDLYCEIPLIYNSIGLCFKDAEPRLFIEEEVKTRRMTNQELSWWLREHPEEHREYMYKSKADEHNVHIIYPYCVIEADEEVDADIYIRRNGGEWQEPLIEE